MSTIFNNLWIQYLLGIFVDNIAFCVIINIVKYIWGLYRLGEMVMKTSLFKKILAVALSVVTLVSAGMFSADAYSFKDVFVSRLNFDIDDDEVVRAIIVYDSNEGAAHTKELCADYGAYLAFSYSELFDGIAVDASYATLKEIEKAEGVEKVYIANKYAMPESTATIEPKSHMASESLGFTTGTEGGSGTVIAVLDTGINYFHEAFSSNYMPSNAALDQATVESIINSNSLSGKYLSKKIPFAYDYADNDTDIFNPYDYHGTNVASTAAGISGGFFKGIAPKAQILGMKIFTSSGYTDSSIYFKAMEDAYLLGADVINLSVGSVNGFSFDYELETELYGNIFKTLRDKGVFICCAAGNEYSQGYSNYAQNFATANTYIDAVTADYADYGVIDTPASYTYALGIGSAEPSTHNVEYELSDLRMSAFSSWGVTPDLKLKPEITGIGGHVICAYSGTSDYAIANGTSLSTPTVSGMIACVKSSYEKDKTALYNNESELYDLIYDSLLSSAKPICDNNGTYYSPRKQGTGVPVYSALSNIDAVLEEPIINLGDDKSKSGVYNFTVRVENIYGKNVTIALGDCYVLSDKHGIYDGSYYNTLTGHLLNASVKADLLSAEYTLSASKAYVDINFTVTLSEEDKNYLAPFTNGGYVEGYIFLDINGKENAIKQTFMGFYGDWGSAPVMEKYDWGDVINAQVEAMNEGKDYQDYKKLLDTNVGYNEAYIATNSELLGYLGDNLYDWVSFNEARLSMPTANNSGDCMASCIVFYPSLLRNVRRIVMTVSNAETGTIYYIDNTEYAIKNYISEGEFAKSTYFTWDGSYLNHLGRTRYVEDGTVIKVKFETLLAYEGAELVTEREYTVYVDNTAPEFTYSWDKDTRLLTVRAKDARYISNISVYSSDYQKLYKRLAITDSVPNQYGEWTVDLSDTDFGTDTEFVLELQDYATNYSGVNVTIGQSSVINSTVKGDVNGDNEVNSLDASWALKYDVGLIELTEKQISAGDVNDSGCVDNLDAAWILKYDAFGTW